MFDIHGLTVARVSRADDAAIREVQSLLERCSDYFELHEGEPPRATAASDEFDLVPAEIAKDDIYILTFREGTQLIAEMTLIRKYPKPEEWWIALFVVDPRVRSKGYGARICNAVFGWIGGQTIALAVDEENPRGDSFWRSLGFIETRRSDYTPPTGMKRRVVIMRRPAP